MTLSTLLVFYGLFLICCGLTAVIFIGSKAKTALMSGGGSGCIALLAAYMHLHSIVYASWLGILLACGLFVVFSWRTTKTLFKIFELIQSNREGLKEKGIAFLLISLMAIVSLFAVFVQAFLFLN